MTDHTQVKLAEAIAARERAEAERDELKQLYEAGTKQWNPVYEIVLNERDAALAAKDRAEAELSTLENQFRLTAKQLAEMGDAKERAEAERDIAEEEASKLWMVLFWLDHREPELTAAAAAKFGLDMQGRVGSRPTTEPAKAENGEQERIDALTKALRECADDLAAWVERYYRATKNATPREKQRYDRDMEPVRRARALLALPSPTVR